MEKQASGKRIRAPGAVHLVGSFLLELLRETETKHVSKISDDSAKNISVWRDASDPSKKTDVSHLVVIRQILVGDGPWKSIRVLTTVHNHHGIFGDKFKGSFDGNMQRVIAEQAVVPKHEFVVHNKSIDFWIAFHESQDEEKRVKIPKLPIALICRSFFRTVLKMPSSLPFAGEFRLIKSRDKTGSDDGSDGDEEEEAPAGGYPGYKSPKDDSDAKLAEPNPPTRIVQTQTWISKRTVQTQTWIAPTGKEVAVSARPYVEAVHDHKKRTKARLEPQPEPLAPPPPVVEKQGVVKEEQPAPKRKSGAKKAQKAQKARRASAPAALEKERVEEKAVDQVDLTEDED